ncbi:glutamate receptor ionotropic, kainate 2 isoform X2 [Folsomia candida]|uniref:glutamate receptor ionotropic, kainate 2 isoform X2 n=1 Tax=Folsomia candida TaxID=158441 RepID=UPI001604A49B|nr:glutamate receptor ionotropic, kainate 2 isoform X2 [Folsomia candida]
MWILYKVVVISVCLFMPKVEARVPAAVRVGSVFLEREQEVHESFRVGIETLRNRQLLNQTEIQFDIQYANRHDYFHLYTRACLEVGYGIVTFFGPSDPGLDKQLESISTALGIPLISTAPRTLSISPGRGGGFPSAFSAENLVARAELTLALFPTQTHLISLVKDLGKELHWKDVSIIHDPVHGIIDPSVLAESLQILGSVSVHQVSTDLRATLVQLRLKGARNIIIDTGVTQLERVIQAALDTGMMTKSYNYLFTMLDMKAGNWSRLAYSEALILGLNMIDHAKFQDFQDRFGPSVSGMNKSLPQTTKVALSLDAVELLARGLEEFDNSGTDLSTPSSTSCTENRKWDVGEELRDVLSTVSFDGMSGPISFANGARSRVHVNILKLGFVLDEAGINFSPNFLPVGNWSEGISYEMDGLRMGDKIHLTNEKPAINKTLIITTTDSSGSCFTRGETGQDEGFCVDLAHHLAKLVGFHFKFKLVSDGRYGRPGPLNGQWDGMVGEIVRGEADIALADLTVTSARQSVVDFTTPFMHTSLAALYKVKQDTLDGVSTLLSPFSIWVWVSIVLAFFITSICLRLVAWMSPYQKDDIILPGSDGSPSLGHDLSWINSMWVLSSTLVLRGCDIRLQAASSRTIAVVWWLFSLVVIIIYASLVSHWFDARSSPSSSPQSVSDLLADPLFEFGVIQSGSTNQFLQNAKREDLQKIWWRVQKGSEARSLVATAFDGIQEVKRSGGFGGGAKYAFVTEEINLNQALVEDCGLGVIKGIDDRSFAMAVGKGSPLREKLSQGILSLGESGVLRQLEDKWWPKRYCSRDGGVSDGGNQTQVKLVHFIGPLSVLVIGIIFAIFIAMIERMFYHRRSHRGFFRTATESGNGKIPMNGSNCDAESEN